ncbi:beta-1:4-N-acetylgalactosaminyltransferase bre-4-like protein [Leptotrombidium deliense]|uniref:Beta-1:4-N-acetylgalactosaminyltransferase bre-4-like protein n=1 Tax=Leptotrombidium deliense TaxID=299467 RepID=A0A443S250_9ACAR|nr:beta-1:4-N-acetylgalactosaminyltransferase bre-4-like protein [Leptotrombidium deliense]
MLDSFRQNIKIRQYFTLTKRTLFVALIVTVLVTNYYFRNETNLPILKTISNNKCYNNSYVNTSTRNGHYIPNDNKSNETVAIVIPVRGREMHLKIFLRYMHPFLMKQQIEYGIYVIEQTDDGKLFNKGRLLNVGYVEALKEYNYSCFIFHDVDLIPESDNKPPYKCGPQPIHLAASVNTLNYKLMYESLIGGVLALTKQQVQKVNGFSNAYWGWGAEDDDLYNRLTSKGYNISRYPLAECRYTMLKHTKNFPHAS